MDVTLCLIAESPLCTIFWGWLAAFLAFCSNGLSYNPDWACRRRAVAIVMPECRRLPGGGPLGPMQRPDERELREQLARLRAEHRDLDTQIVAEEGSALADQLQIKRLKKKKLALKDRITALEDQLLPDIIA
jgi:hypothetical protein